MSVSNLPLHPRLCSNCEHGYLGSGGVFCRFYREDIMDETIAMTCEEYDPIQAYRTKAKLIGAPEPAAPPDVVVVNGRAGIITRLAGPELEQLCDRHLANQPSTLWGELFEVKSVDGRAQAAHWLAEEIREMAALAVEEANGAEPADEHAGKASSLPGAERP
jgi:hypothetical protein